MSSPGRSSSRSSRRSGRGSSRGAAASLGAPSSAGISPSNSPPPAPASFLASSPGLARFRGLDRSSDAGSASSMSGRRRGGGAGLHSDPANIYMGSPLGYGTPSVASTPRSARRSDIGSPRQRQMFSTGPSEEGMSEIGPPTSDGGVAHNTVLWGTTINLQEIMEAFEVFIKSLKDEETGQSYFVPFFEEIHALGRFYLDLDCQLLQAYDAQLYRHLVRYPGEVVLAFDVIANTIYEEQYHAPPARPIQVRTYNIEVTKNMRTLNPEDIDQLVCVKGIIIRTSPVIPELKIGFFKCSRCEFSEEVEVDHGKIAEPTMCKECKAQRSMVIVHNRCKFADKQVIRMQETPEVIPEGQTPHSVTINAYDDMVDSVQPGDRVDVTGIYRAQSLRINSKHRTLRSVFKVYVDAIHFKKTNKKRSSGGDGDDIDHRQFSSERIRQLKDLADSPDIYDKLTAAFAPSIWELDDVKRGLLAQLFGGSNKDFKASGRGSFRGDINILLCGDPGTSKSQLLQQVHKLAPRGIYTSGKGSSSVGLTAYITKDPDTRQLVLESGALVLSDGGVCCIDEFDKMNESTRSVLHEAMEQQTVSIAKAGIICTLNARTSVLAAANPRDSKWNPNLSVVDNILLPPTLLSRFDLIYLVLDKVDEVRDKRLGRHICRLYMTGNVQEQDESIMSGEMLSDYIAYARAHVRPEIGDEAARDLIQGYMAMRNGGGDKHTVTATPRQLESLIRLSEAHARMRFSAEVQRKDVAEALRLIRVALQQAATDPLTGKVDINLLTTGQSAAAHKNITALADAVRKVFSRHANKTKYTFDDLVDLVRKDAQKMAVSNELFGSALEQLRDQHVVDLTGGSFDAHDKHSWKDVTITVVNDDD